VWWRTFRITTPARSDRKDNPTIIYWVIIGPRIELWSADLDALAVSDELLPGGIRRCWLRCRCR
jgi:hypothetical protein